MSGPLSVKGIVGLKVSDAEEFYSHEVTAHNTPRQGAFIQLVNNITTLNISGAKDITSFAIVNATGGTLGITTFQMAHPIQPGYVFAWGFTSTTGLSGVQGTAHGIYWVANIMATVAGTVASVIIFNDATDDNRTAFIGAVGAVTLVANQFVRASVAIFSGFSSFSATITAAGVSVSTVTVNDNFLRYVPTIYLPTPSVINTWYSHLQLVQSMILGTNTYAVSLFSSTYASTYAQAIYIASVVPVGTITVGTILWTGRVLQWLGESAQPTATYMVTIQAILSTTVAFPPGVTHYFTLQLTWQA